MKFIKHKFGHFLTIFDSRVSLVLNSATLLGSAVLPAWAVKSMQVFSAYAPLSWVVAGFLGATIFVFLRLLWIWGKKIAVKAKYDAKMIEAGSTINPLDLTFEGKRIFISDLILPSFPFITDKTFINCELIGPANVHFQSSNQANPIRPPRVDGVWLGPTARFDTSNGFVFNNCIFRGCSFQRITFFAGIENYNDWKDNPNVNWISISPTPEQIAQRMNDMTTPREFGQPLQKPQLEPNTDEQQ